VLHSDPSTVARLAHEGVVAVDMETAAIGAVCVARGVPWSVYRAISDRAGDPEVDAELLGMTRPDGTASPAAVLRFVARHPRRIPKLVRLGRGLQAAVARTTDATLAALRTP
jgi:adenosylhomocysteine nucleosidase